MKRALLIVDVQEGFLRDVVERDGDALARAIAEHARQGQASGYYQQVIATAFVNKPGSLYRSESDWHEMGPSDPARKVPDEIANLCDKVLEKPCYGLTDDEAKLFDQCEVVDVCGIETDQCVMAVCMGLFDRSIRCRVINDLCASTNEGAHDTAIEILGRLLNERNIMESRDVRSGKSDYEAVRN